jgi:hypothetical protein
MLADDLFDRTQTRRTASCRVLAGGARRNVWRPIDYDKNADAMPGKFDDLNRDLS